jgi:hypothetical protein
LAHLGGRLEKGQGEEVVLFRAYDDDQECKQINPQGSMSLNELDPV